MIIDIDGSITITIKVEPRMAAWLKYANVDIAEVEKRVQELARNRIRDMLWSEMTGEEATCIDCGGTIGWVPHREDCRYHKDNLPPELGGRVP